MSFCLLVDKKKLIDPKVIEVGDQSEPEDDLDYIPPSPIPDVISNTTSILETRSVFSVYYASAFSGVTVYTW